MDPAVKYIIYVIKTEKVSRIRSICIDFYAMNKYNYKHESQ